ncbi:putative transporter slc-17.2 [Babylonia areolata]|uniref:putative transporter slc-17.2 n=1 Tax=Babylonia areolata TaxID=304850 RepID=UPI003FD29ECE
MAQDLADMSDDQGTPRVSTGPPKWRSSRFLLAVLVLTGQTVMFFHRGCLSMVIVCMVNHTALATMGTHPPPAVNVSVSGGHLEGGGNLSAWTYREQTKAESLTGAAVTEKETGIPVLKNVSLSGGNAEEKKSEAYAEGGTCDRRLLGTSGSEENEDGPFVWTKETQGLLLGALYWGHMATQVFGGYLFLMFGPRNVTVVSMLVMSVLTMLCHPAAFWSPWAVFVLRVGVGVCTSFAISSLFAIWGSWAPRQERTTLLSLSFSGQNVANSAVFPTAALLCKYGFAGGWPSVFHVYGVLGIAWCLVWMLIVSDTPETSRWIHPEERDYIVANRGQVSGGKDKLSVPWCSIFSSVAFWGIVAGHVTFTWGLYLFMSNLPLYMYEVMNFDIKSNGLFSMLPYLVLFIVQLTGGFLADLLVRRQVMTVFWVRRLVTAMSSLVPAGCLLVMSFLDCTQVAAVMSLLVVSVGFTGFAFSGFLANIYDIAPRYAVSIMSVSTSFGCVPGIVTPYLVAEVTTDQTREQWQIVFFITGAVYLCGTLFFCLFARTTVQSWAVLPPQENRAAEGVAEPLRVDDSDVTTGCHHDHYHHHHHHHPENGHRYPSEFLLSEPTSKDYEG